MIPFRIQRVGIKTYLIAPIIVCLLSVPAMLAQPKYSKELFPVCRENKCGYIDRTGKISIPLQFDDASDFHEGLARVLEGQSLGFIDTTGKIVIKPQFIGAGDFADGLAVVNRVTPPDIKWGYIDQSGRMVIPAIFTAAEGFSEGRAAVRVSDKEPRWGYIDKTGNVVIAPQFHSSFPFVGGLARFRPGRYDIVTKYGAIDEEGRVVIEPKFDTISDDFREGLAPFCNNKKCGYIDQNGRVVIASQFDEARSFSEGLAAVSRRNTANVLLWGFIDKLGGFVIEPQFSQVGRFSEGLACVVDDRIGYADRTGRIVVRGGCIEIDHFDGGLARVGTWDRRKHRAKAGYINKSGKLVWKPT